jgi:hypothetical protein
MRINIVVGLLAGFLLSVAGTCCAAAAQGGTTSNCATSYENHNQTDYGPLKVELIQGTSDVQVGTQKQPGVPGACLVVFTDGDHKLVTSVKADADGRFELKGVAPGHYRLLARAEGFCTANILLEVVKTSHNRKSEILVHFRPAGIDSCSYAEVHPAASRDNPVNPN